MSLSILCVTNNQRPDVGAYITEMDIMANSLGAEFVVGLDRCSPDWATYAATKTIHLTADKLQEDVLDEAVQACSGDWVLRLDDDECVSRALWDWLKSYPFESGSLYAFPRVYLYPDDKHMLTNPGIWPDLQTRLGRKELMTGYTYVHAGNPHGTGRVVPYAIEHHSLLVKDLETRKQIAARYESLRPGAGTNETWTRYLLPELVYGELTTKEYGNGDFSAA